MLTVAAGGMIALAINFSLAQTTTLERFDIQTDTQKKEVRLTLYNPSGDTGAAAMQVQPQKKGKQLNLNLSNTRLSQNLIDSGLPVVIDNQNKLIGRAVPANGGSSSKIVIPNLPSDEYRVVVMQSTPGQATRLVSEIKPVKSNPAMSAPALQLVEQKPRIELASEPLELPNTSHTTTNSMAHQPISTAEPMDMRLNKSETQNKPQPRPAVANVGSEFERIASSFPKPEPVQKAKPGAGAKLPVAINAVAVANENTPQRLINNGSVTYVPSFSSLNGNTVAKNYPIWNPYVVSNNTDGTTSKRPYIPNSEWVSTPSQATAEAPRYPTQPYTVPEAPRTISSSTPRPDPLWYLHSLPPANPQNAAQPSQPLAFQHVPDLTQPLSASDMANNPSLSPAPGAVAGNINLDMGIVRTVKQIFSQLPLWAYMLGGLFFGGIGLFALVGAIVLLQQLWQQLRQKPRTGQATLPAAGYYIPPHPAFFHSTQPVQPANPVAMQANHNVPQEPFYGGDIQPVQFEDTPGVNASRYLKDSHNDVRQAVQNTVLVKFPGNRTGRSSKRSGSARRRVALF